MTTAASSQSGGEHPDYGPRRLPSNYQEWKQLLIEMGSRFYYSSRVPDDQDVVRISTRDVMMRLGCEISHTTAHKYMESAAKRVERAEYQSGDFLWRPEGPSE